MKDCDRSLNKAWASFLLLLFVLFFPNDMAIGQKLPIKASRTIVFNTDEGSYMNVDVSSDGKKLVFDLLGNLYVMPATGGHAIQLTKGLALSLRPVWSPDGSKLAFIGDEHGDYQLFILDLKNKTRFAITRKDHNLRGKSSINWTADGQSVAVDDSVYSVFGIRQGIHLATRTAVRFLNDGSLYGLDGTKLYKYGTAPQKKTIIFSFDKSPRYGITLSPDIHWMAFIADSDNKRSLILQNTINGQKRILARLQVVDERYKNESNNMYQHFCFAPDARSVYIAFGGHIHKIAIEGMKDDIIPFKAKVTVELGPLNHNSYKIKDQNFEVKYARSASLSADGRHLVFMALNKIWIKKLPGGKPYQPLKSDDNQFQPAFSPDGKWIAYVSWSDTIGGYLWKVPVSGGQPVRLTTRAGHYEYPAWCPDGKFIAVTCGDAKLNDRDSSPLGKLLLVSATSGKASVILDSVRLASYLTFCRDSKHLTFTPDWSQFIDRKKDASWLLASVDLNGRFSEGFGKLASKYDANMSSLQATLSPDSSYLYYSSGEDLFLAFTGKFGDSLNVIGGINRRPVIRFAAGVDPIWENGGKTLAWTYGNRFYSIGLKKLLAAEEIQLASGQNIGLTENAFVDVKVTPDKTIPLDISVPCNRSIGTLVIKNVNIITMKNDKPILSGTLIIRNGRIASIGPSNRSTIPNHAKVLDLHGKTLIPGLIDVHLHERIPFNLHPQQDWMFLTNLAYGITTSRDPSQSLDGFGYSELIDAGRMLGPRLFTVGRAIGPAYGLNRLNNLQDANWIVKKRATFGGTEIKQYGLGTRMQREFLTLASSREGLNMTNEGADDPIGQLAMIKDGSTGVEHNPIFGDVFKDIIMLYAKSGTYLTPTLQVGYGIEPAKAYFNEKYWQTQDTKLKRFMLSNPNQMVAEPKANDPETLETIMLTRAQDTLHPSFLTPASIDLRILRSGGLITVGAHGQDQGIGTHSEIWALQMGGFTNMEALRAATLSGAEALGIQKDVGSIEVGKIADLVILNSDPLKDIRNTRDIKYVMKDGILYDGDTLDELWPVKKKCPVWKSANLLGNGYVTSPKTN